MFLLGKLPGMKLDAWINAHKVRMDDFAKAIGVHLVTAYKLRSGKCRPSIRVAAAIERETGGKVTAIDLAPAEPAAVQGR
jgi:DNA-binding XRE family transcriptional regulator